MTGVLRPAIVLFVALTVLTGVVYPLVITGVARAAFPAQADGSIVTQSGKPAGSSLIGQEFTDPKHFWGRLSATAPTPYTSFNADKATGSSGSNYGPLNPALADAAKSRITALHAAEEAVGLTPLTQGAVPIDLVTASGSGLDPHISPAAAEYQLRRVAKARNLTEDAVRAAVARHTRGRQLGFLGEPTVNVLLLNLDLDAPNVRQ